MEYHLVNYHCGRINCSPWQQIKKHPLNCSFRKNHHQTNLADGIKKWNYLTCRHWGLRAFLNENSSIWMASTHCSQKYLGTCSVTDAFVIPPFPIYPPGITHCSALSSPFLGTNLYSHRNQDYSVLRVAANLSLPCVVISLCCPRKCANSPCSCLFHTYLDIPKATKPGGEQA